MLREINKVIPFILLSILILSCSKTAENPNNVIWGETKFYRDVIFYKYEPVIMTQTLELEFNEDAQRLISDDIVFEIVERDETEKFVAPRGINLYKNGVLCSDNILSVKPNEKELELGIEFSEIAAEGNHTLYLRVKNAGGLDRIDDADLWTTNNIILEHEWVVKKNNTMNPLVFSLIVIASFLALIFVLWIIFIRPVFFPHFSIRQIEIKAPGLWKTPRIRSCRKVVLTRKTKKQSSFNRKLTGKIEYIKDDFFIEDIELYPKSFGKELEIKKSTKSYDNIFPCKTRLNEAPIEIERGDEKATIEIL